jgi:hypothetical protein
MTRSQDNLPEEIPGQMTVDEVIELSEQEDGPRKASQVQAQTKLTEEELSQQRTRREVQGRIARRTALKKAGADVPTSSPDLAARLEDSLRRIDRKVTEESRTRNVVQNRLRRKK